MKLKVGDLAPDFELLGSDNAMHKLYDGSGRITVLLFYVGDNTPTCSKQLAEYNDEYAALDPSDVRLLGIAPQSQESHYAFTCRLDLRFPLLVDQDEETGKKFNVVSRLNVYERSTFVLDRNGVVRYVHRGGLLGYIRSSPATHAVSMAKELLATS